MDQERWDETQAQEDARYTVERARVAEGLCANDDGGRLKRRSAHKVGCDRCGFTIFGTTMRLPGE